MHVLERKLVELRLGVTLLEYKGGWPLTKNLQSWEFTVDSRLDVDKVQKEHVVRATV